MALHRTMNAFDDRCRAPFLRARIGHYPPGWQQARHQHDFVQILLVLGGRLDLDLDPRTLVVETSQMAVLPAGCVHAWTAGGRHRLTLFDCCVQPGGQGPDPTAVVLDDPPSPASFPAGAGIRPLIEELEREGANHDLQVEQIIYGLLWQFLALTARARREQQRRGPAAGDEAILRRLDTFLQRRYAEHLQLDDLAMAAGCSAQHLCRVVRRERGYTPMGLLAALRLRQAQRHLLESDLPVGAIAAAVGFADPQHFSRWFRQRSGHSPSTFRDGQ